MDNRRSINVSCYKEPPYQRKKLAPDQAGVGRPLETSSFESVASAVVEASIRFTSSSPNLWEEGEIAGWESGLGDFRAFHRAPERNVLNVRGLRPSKWCLGGLAAPGRLARSPRVGADGPNRSHSYLRRTKICCQTKPRTATPGKMISLPPRRDRPRVLHGFPVCQGEVDHCELRARRSPTTGSQSASTEMVCGPKIRL